MAVTLPPCQTVTVFAFRGDRTPKFLKLFHQQITQEKSGTGRGPSLANCLLYVGHTGVSTDGGNVIYGFIPDYGKTPIWKLMDDLKNGDAFPGVVHDDTTIFSLARQQGLTVLSFDVVLPDPVFQVFWKKVDDERKKSQYAYGFPNGNGDCNCTTWLERLSLPLLTGHMAELTALSGFRHSRTRRFGECV
jgi:hypothetical protein